MHVPVSTIAVTAGRTLKIANHGESHTSVAREILSQTESCCYQVLGPILDFFQLCLFRPVAVNTRRQALDAVDVKIELDETGCGEIGEEALLCGGENSRKLREGDRLAPTPEIKSRTPSADDVAEATACGDKRRQTDFPSPGRLRLAKGGDGGLRAELRSGVNSFNPWIRFLLP